MEVLDPEVVPVVRARDAEGVARIAGEPFLIDLADIERRVRQHEIEATDGVLEILVVGVPLLDIPVQPVDGEVQPREPRGIFDPLLAVDGNVRGGVFPMLLHEAGGLDEHAAGAAGGIQDAPVVRLQDLDDELDDGGGRVELPALLPLRHGEFPEEVFVDEAEGVAPVVHGDGGHDFQQLRERAAVEDVVGLGQHIGEIRVLLLDGAHGVIDRLPGVRALRQAQQLRETGVFRQVDDTCGMVIRGTDLAAARRRTARRDRPCPFQILLHRRKAHIRIAQEDQPEHGRRVFGRFEIRPCPEHVRRIPELLLKGGV